MAPYVWGTQTYVKWLLANYEKLFGTLPRLVFSAMGKNDWLDGAIRNRPASSNTNFDVAALFGPRLHKSLLRLLLCDWPTQPKCTVRLILIVKRRASVLIPPFPEAVESSKSEPRQSWQKFFPFASPILPTPASNLRPSLGRPSNASPLPTATPLNRAKSS